MKICSNCKIEKELSEFHYKDKKNNKLSSCCKLCKKERDGILYNSNHTNRKEKVAFLKKQKIKEGRDFVREIKENNNCYLCNDKRWYILDFHHIDKNTKSSELNILIKKTSIKKIIEEIKKCVLLCSNCHREIHFLKEENKIVEMIKYKIVNYIDN